MREGRAAATSPRRTWLWIGSASKDAGNAILLGLVGVILAVLLVVALAWVAARTPGLRALPVIRGFRTPRMSVAALDDSALKDIKLGAGTTALLRARIAGAGQTAGRVDLAAGEAGSSEALAGLASAGGQVGAIVSLIGLIGSAIRTSQWGVSGELQSDSADGKGLTLSLTHQSDFEAFADFWASTDGGPKASTEGETYRRLTIPAAGWVRHRVAADRDPDRLITTDARSYALFEAGLFWQEQSEPDAAGSFYERALALDPRNIGALANLGVMEYEAGRNAEADELLMRALDALEGGTT